MTSEIGWERQKSARTEEGVRTTRGGRVYQGSRRHPGREKKQPAPARHTAPRRFGPLHIHQLDDNQGNQKDADDFGDDVHLSQRRVDLHREEKSTDVLFPLTLRYRRGCNLVLSA